MAIDKEKYIRKFIDEGLENITLVETLIFDIKDGVSVEDDLAIILRALHTLKGSSRMLEFKKIEELTHCLESVFVAFREQRIGLSENAIKLILSSNDRIKEGLKAIEETKTDDIDITEYTKNLTLLAASEDYAVIRCENEKENNKNENKQEKKEPQEKSDNTKDQKKDYKSESIRIGLDKIDDIIKSIASLQSIEIFAKNISEECFNLNNQLKEMGKIIREKYKDNLSLLSDFRKIERYSDRINTSLKNYAIDTGNSIRHAYDNVISLRTLPLSTLLDSYPRFVYELSQETGKKVQLTIEGKENEIDKNIIESLGEVFMHIIRNSIDHGLELPKDRISSGKNETGNIKIICSRESGSMKIVISDDGCGIDHEKIRLKAVKDGLIAESASLSKEELTNLIFQSGFSTSSKITNISGRGIGMDVVRESIESLKGSIFVESIPGLGTTFTIMLPLSIAALMGFPVVCNSIKFIIPATFVDTILLTNKEDIITVIDRPEIKYNDRMIKLYYLSHILQLKNDLNASQDYIFVVIIRSYDDIAAIAVDNIDSMKSVILKTMPKFIENNSVFSGIVLNEDYEMISVLHIPTIIKMAKRIKSIEIKKRNIELEKAIKSVLVVDDSKPTRDIESDILSSEGYLVDTASDGSIALKMLKSKQYDLILTDLNMPVMNGFQLIENIKQNEDLQNIPIIVISSMDKEEDKQKTYELGASRYIVKSSFNNSNLIDAVNELTGENYA